MLVLGSGEGGKYLAWHMAKSEHRTAVVERKLICGSCPNTNRLPSKNEIWSAKVADLVHHADRFGMVTGSTATDMKKVLARKRGPGQRAVGGALFGAGTGAAIGGIAGGGRAIVDRSSTLSAEVHGHLARRSGAAVRLPSTTVTNKAG
jgi:pyruvate/2-oxoglutarate dehydrogenase complex dihydrolipoamide dehydrogenase (E3) component